MDSNPPFSQPATMVDDKAVAIPLICHLCPRKPTFSDVSHLLTHVSSKSHLAAEFKLKHSKKAEDQDALVQYDQWAQDHGVNDLVANRIAAKEQKKAPKRQRVVGNEVSGWVMLFSWAGKTDKNDSTRRRKPVRKSRTRLTTTTKTSCIKFLLNPMQTHGTYTRQGTIPLMIHTTLPPTRDSLASTTSPNLHRSPRTSNRRAPTLELRWPRLPSNQTRRILQTTISARQS